MKNLKLTFLVTLFTVFSANSQTSFTKFVDKQISETPIAGLVTLDGGYLTIGKEIQNGGYPFYTNGTITKISENGEELWNRTYNINEYFTSAAEGVDGNILLVKSNNFYRLDNITLNMINSSGVDIWEKNYQLVPYSEIHSVKRTLDGGFMMVGFGLNELTNQISPLMVKLTPDGTKLWHRLLPTSIRTQPVKFVETKDGGFAILCTSLYNSSYFTLSLIRTDLLGNIIWHKRPENNYYIVANDIIETADGGYLFTTTDYISFWAKSSVFKTNILGDLEWKKNQNYFDPSSNNSLHEVSDGYIIGGESTIDNSFTIHMAITKISKIGNPVWSRSLARQETSRGYSFDLTNDGSFYMYGQSMNYVKNSQGYLIPNYNHCVVKGYFDSKGEPVQSFVSSVEIETPNIQQLTIYPNPFISEFTVDLSAFGDIVSTLSIYNATGQLLATKSVQKFIHLNLMELGIPINGIYFLKVENELGSFTEIILKK
jgi:hypothetical protein